MGPILANLMKKLSDKIAFFENIVLLAIAGIVVAHLFPKTFADLGWEAILYLLAGFTLPTLLEKSWHSFEEHFHQFAILISIVGLALHGFFDGFIIAFSSSDQHTSAFLSMGAGISLFVVLHRVPAAMFLWIILKARYGTIAAVGVLAILGVFTIAGFVSAQYSFYASLGFASSQVFVALACGTMFHLAMHRPHSHL